MTDEHIIKIVEEELKSKSFAVTKQFLEIHDFIYKDGKPLIKRIDRGSDDNLIVVYLPVKDEQFYFAVYIDGVSESLLMFDTEPYIRVYFKVFSETMNFQELSSITSLMPTRGWNKGDLRLNGKSSYIWSEINFLPNPEPDEFENKLEKLLTYLEHDPEGVKTLVEKANGYIQVAMNFHNGNGMLGGPHIHKKSIKRMSNLNLEIDFDLYAEGNLFKEK